MILACIDIGSNTSRLLVADVHAGKLRGILSRREQTRIGRGFDGDGRIPSERIERAAAVAGAHADAARAAGAAQIAAVATAAVRRATNRDELTAAVEHSAGLPLRVLSSREEARLSFLGATRSLDPGTRGTIAMVDVGGGSTEIAVGPAGGAMEWSASLPVGLVGLSERRLRSDPPRPGEIAAARAEVAAAFDEVRLPPATYAVGAANTLHSLLGDELDHATLARGLELLCSAPVAELATRPPIDPERLRLLPGGILILQAASAALGLPVRPARGGLREGAVLELHGLRAARS